MNTVSLVGRLTREIDLRYTSNGKAVGSFTLAVDRQFKNAQGEKETDFINAVIWGKSAENLANYTRKGSLIGVIGRLQTRNYENQQGQRVFVTEVVVENFTLLESREVTEQRPRGESNGGGFQGGNSRQSNSQTQNNFSNYNTNEDPFLSSGQSIDISDDDLPF